MNDRTIGPLNKTAVHDRIGDDTRLECRICWYMYDPAEGDELEQIPPGTPFLALPDHWRCPQCDSGKEMFLPLDD